MPRLLNLGSLNIDLVYRTPHIVRPGETLGASAFSRGAGGKGLNQSIAAARAGVAVHHAGRIGSDGIWLRDLLASHHVDVSRVLIHPDETSGHAIIQVAASGENAIVLHPGTNHAFSASDLPALLASFSPGDWFLAQNETSCVPEALHAASAAGLRVVLNPAPMSPEVKSFPLDVVDLLVVNETEAAGLSGKATPHEAMDTLRRRLPRADIVLTLGARGAWFSGPSGEATASPPRVHATDTTAAGDTFIGYLLAGLMEGAAPAVALARACTAAAISTTRPGAASSIPSAAEVAAFVAAK